MKACYRAGATIEYQRGTAIINKVNEPYIVTKKTTGNKFSGRFTGRAEPDFKGVLYGGRAIAFEAKSTQKSRIQRNAVTDTQMEWTKRTEGFWSRYICGGKYTDKFYSVPFDVDDMKTFTAKSFNARRYCRLRSEI